MTTTSFGEPAIAILENQVDAAPHPSPAPRVKRKTWQTVIWFVVLLAITAVVLYPLVWLFLSTFKPNAEFGANMGLLPNNPTLENYAKVSEGIAGVPMWRSSSELPHHRRRLRHRRGALRQRWPPTRSPASSSRDSASSSPR